MLGKRWERIGLFPTKVDATNVAKNMGYYTGQKYRVRKVKGSNFGLFRRRR
jgi:hypothetical protein